MSRSINHITFVDQSQVADYYAIPVQFLQVVTDTRYQLLELLDSRSGHVLAFRPVHGGCWGIV